MAVQRDKVIAAAEKLIARGKIEAGIREYERLLDDNPNLNPLNRIGDLWIRLARNDEAIKVFRRIATHYSRDGFFLKAIAINKKITKLEPSDTTAHAALADLYAKQGLTMEAKSEYQVLADICLKTADLPNALAMYLKIAELDPVSTTIRAKLAELYALNGRVAEARVERARLITMLIKRGMLDEAETVFKKDANLGPVDPELVESLAAALIDAKNHNAIEVLTIGLRDHKGNPALTALLAQALTDNGQMRFAIDLLEPLIAEHPENATARKRAADAYLKLKDTDAALRILIPLVDQAVTDGDPAAAARVLQRIVDVDPFHKPTSDRLGSILNSTSTVEKQAALLEVLESRFGINLESSSNYIPLEIEPATGRGNQGRDGLEQLLEWSRSSDAGAILLSGPPGGGKTTLLGEVRRHLEGHRPAAIYIPLAESDDSMTVDALLRFQLSIRNIDVGSGDLRDVFASGKAVLLLDGLDEIRSEGVAAALVDDILAWSRIGQTKTIVTTRNSFVPDVPFSGHFRLRGPLHERIRITLRQRVPEPDRWLDLLTRLDLFEACHNPQFLRIVCDFAAHQRHDAESALESSMSSFFERLIEFECHEKRADRAALQRIAAMMWRDGILSASAAVITRTITGDAIDSAEFLLGNRLLRREDRVL